MLLVGDGPERRNQTEGIAILPGFLDDLSEFHAALDVFIMPSRSEGWGLTALQAMANGLAVIASDVGGLRELVGARGGKRAGLSGQTRRQRWLTRLKPRRRIPRAGANTAAMRVNGRCNFPSNALWRGPSNFTRGCWRLPKPPRSRSPAPRETSRALRCCSDSRVKAADQHRNRDGHRRVQDPTLGGIRRQAPERAHEIEHRPADHP